MMRLTVDLLLADQAFDNGPGPLEVARQLRLLVDRLERGDWKPDHTMLFGSSGTARVESDQ